MENYRDWEIISIDDALNRKFGYDIYPREFKKITGNLTLVMLSMPEFFNSEEEMQKVAPLIRKGALIDDALVNSLKAKNCTVVPVTVIGEPGPLNALSQFAKQQTNLLAGKVYSCVEEWFDNIRKDRAVDVIQAVKKYRTPLLQSLNNALKDWEATITTLTNDILVSDENLSILSLFDEYIGEENKVKEQKEHGIEVAVLALMLAKKCKLDLKFMKKIGVASILHDIGIIVYEQKLKEYIAEGGYILEPELIKESYDMHPVFGAMLLTKKNGHTISGIASDVREMILEHEQENDGSGPRLYNKEFSREMDVFKIKEDMVYFGDNSIKVDYSKPKHIVYPEKNLTKCNLTLASQILHISEMYVTKLNMLMRKNVPDPHKEALTLMLYDAGHKINGRVFEIFFNYLVPPIYYPDNLLVKLKFLQRVDNVDYTLYNDFTGVILSRQNEDGRIRKFIHLIRDDKGNELPEKRNFDIIKNKRNMFLMIDEWRH